MFIFHNGYLQVNILVLDLYVSVLFDIFDLILQFIAVLPCKIFNMF